MWQAALSKEKLPILKRNKTGVSSYNLFFTYKNYYLK